MEGKDVYILLAFALLRRRRPASPHRRSLCRFTGDHPAHHVDDALLGLTPEHGQFSNISSLYSVVLIRKLIVKCAWSEGNISVLKNEN